MPKPSSREAVFQIVDTAGTTRNLSQYINSVTGIPGVRELMDVSALGDSGRRWISGLEQATIVLEGHFDTTTTTGPDAVLGVLRTNTTVSAWNYGPNGLAVGQIRYSGSGLIRNYVADARLGEVVVWRCEIENDGVVTRGTY